MSESLTQIGKYRIERELGRGGMGVVYRAFDPVVERTVAIKTIRLDVEDPANLAERLKREAKSVGQLEHPNIVTLYDAGEAEGLFYLAMQFIQGETLQQRIERQKWFTWNEVHELMRQICSGLGYAHHHGVVHRDIKPANIMITTDGLVKLTDFGIAKLADAGTLSSGMVVGTPSYMSPEQALGKPVDARSDIFSLGSILYELTTAEKAFPGQNATTIIYKIVHEVPVPVTSLQPGLDPELDAIVLRALAKSPDQRFQGCQELAQALESYTAMLVSAVPKTTIMSPPQTSQARPVEESRASRVSVGSSTSVIAPATAPAGLPVSTGPLSPGERPEAAFRRRSPVVWMGAVALGILFVMVAALLIMQLRRSGPVQESVSPPTVDSPRPTTQKPSSAGEQREVPPQQPAEEISSRSEPAKSEPHPSAVVEPPKAERTRAPAKAGSRRTAAEKPAASSQKQTPAASSSSPSIPQPETYDSLIVSGDVAFQQGEYQQALDAYRKAYRLNPRSREARRKIALALTLLGRAEEARQYQ